MVAALPVGYVCVWEFIASPDHVDDFESAYGESGDWVRLFQRARGHVRSELHRDVAIPRRYLTIDYWESEAAYEAFRSRFSAEYQALDAKCAAWTTHEAEVGRFAPVRGSP